MQPKFPTAIWALAVCIAVLLFPAAVHADWSGFLRLDGASGESQDASHIGWIDVSAATSASLTNSELAGGMVSEQALVLTKNLDAASPTLALMCARGQKITTGTLDLTTTNTAVPALRLELKNIFVTSVTQSNNPDGPIEQVLILPQITQWCYVQFNTNSGLPSYATTQWDFSANNGSASTVPPKTITTGIRVTNGVQLSWNATTGQSYCIFAVAQLGIPFTPLVSQTATNTGPMIFTVSTTNNALFYVVNQLP